MDNTPRVNEEENQRDRLAGILDFEWALSGDPSYDFMVADTREQMLPGSEETFVDGYLSIRPFDEWHNRRIDIYRLFLWLETAVMYEVQGDHKGVKSALANMLHLLENVEMWLGV